MATQSGLELISRKRNKRPEFFSGLLFTYMRAKGGTGTPYIAPTQGQ